MQDKLYLKTWLICLLFAFWFFIIPLIVGIILLVLKIRQENENELYASQLYQSYTHAKNMLTPEMKEAINIQNKITELQVTEQNLQNRINGFNSECQYLDAQVAKKRELLVNMDDEILVQEFGLYKPMFEFSNSDGYKDKLNQIRNMQKEMIKQGSAASGNMAWTVNGNATQGKKMVTDMQKLLLRAFNSECDTVISKVKYNNFDASLKRLEKSRDAISKLGKIMNISLTNNYFQLKVQELHLALEYQIIKQDEKEAAKEARAEMREAAKLQKELEEQRRKVEKEQNHYQNALLSLLKQIESSDSPSQDLLNKKLELESQLQIIDTSLKDLDYREANQRAGYVYVISNIGAFGENVYKIGMTRRINPQERVDELGDASVPFNFDIHAMIFSEDAPALENALHKAFDDRKLNMVNKRREFFNVTLDEIKDVIRENYDKTVEFIDVPDASQYRESVKMKELT